MRYAKIPGAVQYKVGDDGTVWSIKSGHWRKLKPVLTGGIKGGDPNRRRPAVNLVCDDGHNRQRKIHQLVAFLHLGDKPPGASVLHKDDDKRNNVVTNLYYGDSHQNAHDRGDNRLSPLARDDVRAIRESPLSNVELARQYGVCRTTIWKIRAGHTWSKLA
ncbi:HNH endonuclease [Paludisphaera borealis]|uniref:HNH nuclease domain-containing protein n=1 Tax=Paludisphaera borealis TaxID=1387353 RepID=A0A1U7CX98_9BACT|nr:HNH endonuclease [Paludisphaera borealis]APW63518.1 hypothetical protein BSF38_05090 [Paludisphaera borealis]